MTFAELLISTEMTLQRPSGRASIYKDVPVEMRFEGVEYDFSIISKDIPQFERPIATTTPLENLLFHFSRRFLILLYPLLLIC